MTDDELEARMNDFDQRLSDLLKSIAEQREADRRWGEEMRADYERRKEKEEIEFERRKEEDQRRKEEDRLRQEAFQRNFEESKLDFDRRQQIALKETEELKKQIGGLGNKFGSFTEGLALPSMTRILTERFGAEFIAPRVRRRLRDGRSMELDVLAYVNGVYPEPATNGAGANGSTPVPSETGNRAYIVEVKSHVRPEHLEQMTRKLEQFHSVFPEHRDKELYGILAGVDISEEAAKQFNDAGIYLARIEDEHFEIVTAPDFEPRSFRQVSKNGA